MIEDEDDLPVLHEVVRSGNTHHLRRGRNTLDVLSDSDRPAQADSVHFDLPAHLQYDAGHVSGAALADASSTKATLHLGDQPTAPGTADRLQFDIGLGALVSSERNTSRFASIDARPGAEAALVEEHSPHLQNTELDLDDTLDLSGEGQTSRSWLDDWDANNETESGHAQDLTDSFDLHEAIGLSSVSSPPDAIDDELDELIDELIDRHITSLRKDIRDLLERSLRPRRKI